MEIPLILLNMAAGGLLVAAMRALRHEQNEGWTIRKRLKESEAARASNLSGWRMASEENAALRKRIVDYHAAQSTQKKAAKPFIDRLLRRNP